MEIKELSKNYIVRKIQNKDIDEVLKIMEGNPLFFKHCPPSPTKETIKEDLSALPPNKTIEDKYYIGYFKNNELIAIMDLIDKYPNDKALFVGFFMINNKYQEKGVGSSIINELFNYAKTNAYEEIRLGYVSTNNQSKSFWHKNGFIETGVISHQELYDVVVMRRLIKA